MYTEIKSKEAALKALNLKETGTPTITGIPEEFHPILLATYDALLRAKAIRAGWTPDYQVNTLKWEPWYYMRKDKSNPSGFRFGGSDCTYASTRSVLGPLLAQETEEKSDFLAKQLEEVFAPVVTKQE